jgi:hypothetical protein
MTFVQPVMLFGLPAVLLPVLIHLLNRLRYRSQKWAAIMFLVSATRSSVRHARLRHYLILLFRTITVACLVLALSRPVIGGWLGMTLAGSPDTVLVLLDRSASIEATDSRTLKSKRSRALSLFAQAASQARHSSRFVLIENVLRQPQEIADLSALGALSIASATDTAADIPAMFRSAVDYILKNTPGNTEIWIASDMQKSNWRPDSQEWQSLNAQLSSLSQNSGVRVLSLCEPYGHNVGISLHDARRHSSADASELDLSLDLSRVSRNQETFPVIITLDGSRSQVEATMAGAALRLNRKLDISSNGGNGGWGKVEIPADENPRDNACYFVYGKQAKLRAVVVPDSDLAGKRIRLAIAPSQTRANRTCEVLQPENLAGAALQEQALFVLQAPLPAGQSADMVRAFVENGGVAVLFPPDVENAPAPFGLTWGKIETTPKKSPFRISVWDENDGPLANTDNGMNLPLAKLAIQRRQNIVSTNSALTDWHAAATYVDGKPFLLQRRIGNGQVFVCTSLPLLDWSNLSDGKVMVPMMQRMLALGGERLSQAQNAICGVWRPLNEQEAWTCVDTSESKDYRWQAGVYQSGAQLVALNVPSSENDQDFLGGDETRKLMPDVKVRVLEEFSSKNKEPTQSELWPLFICLSLLSMMIESGLLLSDRVMQRDEKEKNAQ